MAIRGRHSADEVFTNQFDNGTEDAKALRTEFLAAWRASGGVVTEAQFTGYMRRLLALAAAGGFNVENEIKAWKAYMAKPEGEAGDLGAQATITRLKDRVTRKIG